ncbi:hypothetical protein [Aquimarina longa]|nr:hypothetical protein [Aquimarina longa]
MKSLFSIVLFTLPIIVLERIIVMDGINDRVFVGTEQELTTKKKWRK